MNIYIKTPIIILTLAITLIAHSQNQPINKYSTRTTKIKSFYNNDNPEPFP